MYLIILLLFHSYYTVRTKNVVPPSWRNIKATTPEDWMQCDNVKSFSPGQTRLCQVYKDHMPGVVNGAKMALLECQFQFKLRRWNCSTHEDDSVYGPMDRIGSREAAFTYAITAAGIAYSISRGCRDGQLSSCSCSRAARPRDLHEQWIWGGCGDNLEYGYKFTQGFIDIREREVRYRRGTHEQGIALMNLHNNEAGRRGVIKVSRVTCKCHGVSGSCSLITCWQQLPSFRQIGDYIRDKYDGATEVRINRRGRLQTRDVHFNKPSAHDLIYIDHSPNYCVFNQTNGSLGTQGRQCNKHSLGLDGCKLMCCGRGYNTRKTTIKDRCNCKFHWCCFVNCQLCEKTIDIHTCK